MKRPLTTAVAVPQQQAPASGPPSRPENVFPPAFSGYLFRRYFRHTDIETDQKVSLRNERRQVICADCGTFENSRDICPQCGGHAQPLANSAIVEKFRRATARARSSFRRAAARRKRAVIRR